MTAPSQPPSALELYRLVRAELNAHPYRTIAIAAGVGYVLGTRLGRSVLTLLAGRLGTHLASRAMAPLLDDLSERG